MGKAPAFQFYPNDWSRDLEEHPLEIEGAWIRICCKLWWAETRGQLKRTPDQWAKVLRVDATECDRILNYIEEWKIGDVSRNGNGEVTLISRRMMRDDKDRELNRLRQERFRVKHFGNADITPSVTPLSQRSSSSSSSSTLKKESISHSETKIFLTFYANQFKEEFGTDPVIEWGKDGKIIKGLLKFIPFENLKDLLNKFFLSEDKFIQKSGYTIGVFKSQLNKLKIGEGTKDGMDLWLTVKEKQDEKRGRKEICPIDEKVKGDIPDQLE